MSIYDKILKKGQTESDLIRKEAELEAKTIEHAIVAEAEKEAALLLARAEEAKQSAIAQASALAELEKKQSISALKNKTVDEIFNAVLSHFKALEGSELLAFVHKQIRSEEIEGSESMRVNSRDYERYLKALSTHKKSNRVELDLLNKSLGNNYRLFLEDISSNEEEGFLLVGDTYDLNFSVKPILDRIRKRKEKELFAVLFDKEGK
ncbi:MAG: hypothetical protein PHU55_00215 [Bacilli bacterium]|nr:hypothetical protein [Bacilli bacterium]